MYTHSYSKKVTGISKDKLWNVWTDVNNWNQWRDDIEYAKLDSSFKEGEKFTLKPKRGPKASIKLIKVIHGSTFIDLTKFPLARMYGQHDFVEHSDGLEVKVTMSIEGPFSFLWKVLVYDNIVKSLQSQTDALIREAQKRIS